MGAAKQQARAQEKQQEQAQGKRGERQAGTGTRAAMGVCAAVGLPHLDAATAPVPEPLEHRPASTSPFERPWPCAPAVLATAATTSPESPPGLQPCPCPPPHVAPPGLSCSRVPLPGARVAKYLDQPEPFPASRARAPELLWSRTSSVTPTATSSVSSPPLTRRPAPCLLLPTPSATQEVWSIASSSSVVAACRCSSPDPASRPLIRSLRRRASTRPPRPAFGHLQGQEPDEPSCGLAGELPRARPIAPRLSSLCSSSSSPAPQVPPAGTPSPPLPRANSCAPASSRCGRSREPAPSPSCVDPFKRQRGQPPGPQARPRPRSAPIGPPPLSWDRPMVERIRSTTSVCLLHGLVLLPSGISVAGAVDTSAGDATELKWELDEDLVRCVDSFHVVQ
ncbi:uncharacterized protein [Aegilops tauschii subsp. strangulata]|uniref:uncharacterized protein n=1 Tax=Aegilops tauschii subsp. strangulata TaxID=200361 RepID=UPI003CC86B5B